MELEELKQQWTALDQRIHQHLADVEMHQRWERQTATMQRVQSRLTPLFWGQLLQLCFGIVFTILAATYWTSHREQPHEWVSGIIVHVYGILVIVVSGICLGKLGAIDYAGPVAPIQQRVQELRQWVVWGGAMVGLPWWLLWLPFMQVVFGLLGADFLGFASSMFLWSNVAVGLLGAIATWGFHVWLHRPGREALASRMERDAAGKSVTDAEALLAEWQRDLHRDPE